MTASYTLSIYEILAPVIKNEQKTKELVQNIEQVIDAKFEEKKDELATKKDIWALKEDVIGLENSLLSKMNDQFKWLVGIMISLFGLAITIMFFLIKK